MQSKGRTETVSVSLTAQKSSLRASKLPSPFAPASSKGKRRIDCPSGMAKKAKFMTLKECKEVTSIDHSENSGNDIHDTLKGTVCYCVSM